MTKPYTCQGQKDYTSHSGPKPVAILWTLHRTIPVDVYVEVGAVVQ